ncbi:Minor histocompatibility antigen H13 [Bagarius yarrelli]|uniref:Minor histocompatibility antigen H13 n=1 Tax=Bagarius yarrelli TaxID=175774 RepID=A0A556VXF5_BAGYA|nr:Minor histocompatibility antigen H13 [Bagarius yarrelli]
MADVEQGSALPPLDGLNSTENGTDSVNGTAARFVATAEGTALAYGSLVLMALLPIFFGALRSIFSQEYINLLLSMYFFVLGILALSHTLSPFINRFLPVNLPLKHFQLLFTQGSGENREEIVNYEFDTKDLISLGLSSVPALLYLVPACVGFPVIVALFKGELTEMFSYESSDEVLPHTPRLTRFPTVSGSPASLANSMQSPLSSSPRRRHHALSTF